MAHDNSLKAGRVQRAGFDELEQTGFVFCATGLERDGGKMVAISSGMGIYGANKGIVEYRAMGRLRGFPRIVCAQQARCAPMYRAFHDNAKAIGPEHIEKRPQGIAKAILRGDPTDSYPFMRDIVTGSGGTFEAVSDEQIYDAQR